MTGRDAFPVSVIVGLTLIVQPGVTALLATVVFHLSPFDAHVTVLLSALPIGSGPFTITKLYRIEARVTSGTVLASHLISVVMVSALVAWSG